MATIVDEGLKKIAPIFNWSTLLWIFGSIGVLALIGFGIYKWIMRRRHNISIFVKERRGEKVYPYFDFGWMYREEGKVKLHLYKKKILVEPPEFQHIERDELNHITFIEFIKEGVDDYKLVKTEFSDAKVKPIRNDVRMWFVETWKEAFNKYLNKGLNKWLPMIMMIVLGAIFIIGLWIVSSNMKKASETIAGAQNTFTELNNENAKLIFEASKNNLELAKILGIVEKNATTIEKPIG
jgi:hypothetical protein